MSEGSAQQQPAVTDVQQMQQVQQQQQQQNQQQQSQQNQNQQMQQPQQIQVMIQQQPQSQVDMQQQQAQSQQQPQQVAVASGQQTITMQMSSDGSNGGAVQLPHSSAPMATIEVQMFIIYYLIYFFNHSIFIFRRQAKCKYQQFRLSTSNRVKFK